MIPTLTVILTAYAVAVTIEDAPPIRYRTEALCLARLQDMVTVLKRTGVAFTIVSARCNNS
jgi:hypothetical protein